MATIFARPPRVHYYAKIRDPRTLSWKSVVTPFKTTDPSGKRKALMWATERDRLGKENRFGAKKEAWASWVPDWLVKEYSYNLKTLKRYQNAWAPTFEFLVEEAIAVPRQLEYAHAEQYLEWRTKQKRHSGKLINHNTAVTELKVLSRIMREAHRKGFVDGNPFYQLGLKRIDVKEKPEMSDAEVVIIRTKLVEKPAWMRVCFEIAIHQGCRLSETQVPLDWVDLERGLITFKAKGRKGQPHVFTTALHPALRSLFAKLKRENLSRLACEHPPMAAKEWHFFFKEIGLPHLSFHSTRVTVVTKMARNNVTQQKAMAFVGHASATIHRVYQRLTAQDLKDVTSAISSSMPATP